MTTRLVLEYLVWVFFSSLGVLQIAFTRAGLRGACFFRSPRIGYAFGTTATLASFLWFFLSENRGRPGLEGSQTFSFFVLGGSVALAFTFALTSLLRGKEMTASEPGQGLEALRQATYLQALKVALQEARTRWSRPT